MQGCNLDTDHDGNCPIHPRGCPGAEVEDLTHLAEADTEPTVLLVDFKRSKTAAAEAEAAKLMANKQHNPVR